MGTPDIGRARLENDLEQHRAASSRSRCAQGAIHHLLPANATGKTRRPAPGPSLCASELPAHDGKNPELSARLVLLYLRRAPATTMRGIGTGWGSARAACVVAALGALQS